MIDNGILADAAEVVLSKGERKSLFCKGYHKEWSPVGRCPRCGRHWTDILGTKDFKARIRSTHVPEHRERGKKVK